ncbi:MAG TPA: ABC transporter substrate-binding protein [Burkholderiaceae bacterium]|nr:ABC transporter substrate-binding protein [Burkholderiaceae bacterium]
MVSRRGFALVLLTLPLAVRAQPAGRVARLGFVFRNAAAQTLPLLLDAFRQGLAERGWVEGANAAFDVRYGGSDDQVTLAVADLIAAKVDIVVATSSAVTWAAKMATRTIPIVMTASSDAVGEGLVASLARPGGNVTGMTFLVGPEIASKQLQLLKELVPSASRVAVLANPTNRSHRAYVIDLKAHASGVLLQEMEVSKADQLEPAFAAMAGARADALLVLTDSMFLGQRQRIVELATQRRLPALYSQREYVDAGGLASYGPSLMEMSRRAATHADKILRGTKPGDIPVEQPTKFELVVNLKSAQAIGLSPPKSLRLRADQLIE